MRALAIPPVKSLVVSLVAVMLLAGCAGGGMKGESAPDMSPMRPSADVTVTENGDLICVTENDDPATRTCVPRVHEEETR